MLRRGLLLCPLAPLIASCFIEREELHEAAPHADEFAQSMLRHLANRDLNSILAVVDPISRERLDRRSLEKAAEQLPDDILLQAVQYNRKINKSVVPGSTDITGTATFRFVYDSALFVLSLSFSRKAGSFYVDQLHVSPYKREK